MEKAVPESSSAAGLTQLLLMFNCGRTLSPFLSHFAIPHEFPF